MSSVTARTYRQPFAALWLCLWMWQIEGSNGLNKSDRFGNRSIWRARLAVHKHKTHTFFSDQIYSCPQLAEHLSARCFGFGLNFTAPFHRDLKKKNPVSNQSSCFLRIHATKLTRNCYIYFASGWRRRLIHFPAFDARSGVLCISVRVCASHRVRSDENRRQARLSGEMQCHAG